MGLLVKGLSFWLVVDTRHTEGRLKCAVSSERTPWSFDFRLRL